jgi:hypothetical protein
MLIVVYTDRRNELFTKTKYHFFDERYLVSPNHLLALREKESPKVDLSSGSSIKEMYGFKSPSQELPFTTKFLGEYLQLS